MDAAKKSQEACESLKQACAALRTEYSSTTREIIALERKQSELAESLREVRAKTILQSGILSRLNWEEVNRGNEFTTKKNINDPAVWAEFMELSQFEWENDSMVFDHQPVNLSIHDGVLRLYGHNMPAFAEFIRSQDIKFSKILLGLRRQAEYYENEAKKLRDQISCLEKVNEVKLPKKGE